jgi:ABC-type Fe3+-hydroxamate transport system substrate-binding protein
MISNLRFLKNTNILKIISLVPSQTELLFDLGLGNRVVGITKFCIHPKEWYDTKARIGGTKTIDFDKIKALKPDLIIANKEENEESQIRYLQEHYPVWISDIYTLDDALAMIKHIGLLCDVQQKANEMTLEIVAKFHVLQEKMHKNVHKPTQRPRIAYLIWRKPYMVAANDTYINDIIHRAGFENIFADKTRYPEITLNDIAVRQPDYVFLSSEPYPFQEKHFRDFQEAMPNAIVKIVDGEMFSWYGSRLLKVPSYLYGLQNS